MSSIPRYALKISLVHSSVQLLPCDLVLWQVIGSVLDLLTPQRANLLLLSPDNQGRCLLRERWFGTCFSCDGTALWASSRGRPDNMSLNVAVFDSRLQTSQRSGRSAGLATWSCTLTSTFLMRTGSLVSVSFAALSILCGDPEPNADTWKIRTQADSVFCSWCSDRLCPERVRLSRHRVSRQNCEK